MEKRVAVIHTSFVTVDLLKSLFHEIIPEVRMINIVDDSLLSELTEKRGITPSIVRRVCKYAVEAEAAGADAIFNQCSSVGEAVDIARTMLKIPYIKIDEAMAEEAVKIGGRISVVATAASTIGPSCRLIEKTAQRLDRRVKIRDFLADGALDVLMKEDDRERHDKMVLEEIKKAGDISDVIVLAQGSMAALLPQLGFVEKPVISSPRLGVERLRKVLNL